VGDWVEPRDVDLGLSTLAWEGRLGPERQQRMRAGYMGSISHIDCQLGRLLEWLVRDGGAADTMVVFTSDHGDMMGDHHRLRKCHPYEGSARIPMLVRYPKGVDAPTGTFEQPVGLQDIMPTILEAAGVDVPDTVTGRSLFAAARGEPWREFIHGEHSPCYSMEHANEFLTDGREKYIWFPATDCEQLFDLATDRREMHDLAAERPERVAAWRRRMIEALAGRGDGLSDGTRLVRQTANWGPIAKHGMDGS
jgi:arylsulfatase A-like enzyme